MDTKNDTTGSVLSSKYIVILAFVVFFGVIVSGLLVPVVENACKYAQVSREMVDSGDWIHLTIAREPYEQKPPLLFWLGALSYMVFGVSFISFKLPVIILSLLGIFSTYKLGQLFYGKKAGRMAAFFYATSLGYFYFHNDIHTDTVLANFVVLAIWQLTAYLNDKKWHQFVLGIVAIGFAMLAKGPVGLAIPAAAIGANLLVHRKFREIFHWRWLVAVPIVLVIISPALIGLYKQFGIEGLKFFFWTNNVGRVTGSYHSTSSDITFYLHNLILVSAPWFLFVYAAFILEIRKWIRIARRKEKISSQDEMVNLSGFLLFFVVLSIASQKNPHYLLSILPLSMILTGKWVLVIFEDVRFNKLNRVLNTVHLILPLIFIVLVGLFLFWIYPEKRLLFWIIAGAVLVAMAYSYLKQKGNARVFAVLLLSQFFFFLSLNISILPSMLNYESPFRVCRVFNREAPAESRLHSYRLRYWDIFYYSKNYGTWARDDEGFNKIMEEKNPWIFTDKTGLGAMDHWGVPYKIRGEFKHRNITGQTISFLNPKTRESKLQTYYLVELKSGNTE